MFNLPERYKDLMSLFAIVVEERLLSLRNENSWH